MSVRQWISSNPAVVAVIAIAITASAIVFVFVRDGRANVRQTWFYDVGSSSLFAYTGAAIPPVTAPSGQAGVRAHVYACGECSESTRRILYLETLDPKQNKTMVADPSVVPLQWYALDSNEGINITASLEQLLNECTEGNLKMCAP